MAIKPMIDKAASLEESLSKNRLMFGEASKAVERFAETAGHAFGVSERAALEATGIFGSLGNAMGMSEEASASMATTLTGLAGDLSSLHDVDVETALTALRAGLIGEAEPLRKLGILLDAATIKSKALEMGLVKTTKDALTPAIKSQAAYALILEKGEIAMGDFVRTSDSATNQSKLLAIEWDKIQTEIGTALLPAFTAIVTHLNEVVLPAVRKFWSDPSWYEAGVLAGEALGSGFITSITDVVGGLSEDEIDDLGWQDSWKASAELRAIVAGVGAAWQFITGARDTLQSDPAQQALRAAFESAAAAMAGRPLDNRGNPVMIIAIGDPDWDRGDWETAGRSAGEVFYGAAGEMAPGPGFPPFGPDLPPAGPMAPGPGFPPFRPDLPPMIPGPMIPAPTLPPFVPPPMVPAPGFPAPTLPPFVPPPMVPAPGFPPPFVPPAIPEPFVPPPMIPGPQVPVPDAPTDAEVAAWLASPGAQAMFAGFTGDPGQRGGTTVTNNFNITGVSPGEVMDAIGEAVDLTGPMPPHWQQSTS
jgi:hypothetical protein